MVSIDEHEIETFAESMDATLTLSPRIMSARPLANSIYDAQGSDEPEVIFRVRSRNSAALKVPVRLRD